MAGIDSFEDLKAWRCAREVANLIYDATDGGAFARDFALKDQIRRSVISVVSNIAEGFERDGNKEFMNFLSIAKGSCGEARAQLYLALDRDYNSQHQFQMIAKRLKETSRMIHGLIRYLRSSDYKGPKFR